jgi:hypothetical protein
MRGVSGPMCDISLHGIQSSCMSAQYVVFTIGWPYFTLVHTYYLRRDDADEQRLHERMKNLQEITAGIIDN